MTNKKPDPTIEALKERSWQEVGALDQALTDGQIDEKAWHNAMADLIKQPYLQAESIFAQAGHGGDAHSWEKSRGFIAEALHRNGTFLDVGCANGLLMESVQRWGAAQGLTIAPYGLEIVPELAALARQRLPQWSKRIFEGNIRSWQPTDLRFDYTLIRPSYAPPKRLPDLVRHTLRHILKPNGRLIIFVGAEEKEARLVENALAAQGDMAHGHVEVPHAKDARMVRRLFWIDGAE